MDSNFKLEYTTFFAKQWDNYDSKTRDIIKEKLRLLRDNPFRYPTHKGYLRVRKVKVNIEGKYQRLMYAVHIPESNHILILGVFARDMDYRDFEKKFKHLKKK